MALGMPSRRIVKREITNMLFMGNLLYDLFLFSLIVYPFERAKTIRQASYLSYGNGTPQVVPVPCKILFAPHAEKDTLGKYCVICPK